MAALDDGLLHLALAHELDALQAGAQRRQHRQPRPAHLGGHRRIHQRRRRRRLLPQRRHLQLHHRRDHHRDQSGGVLDHPVGHLADHGLAHFRSQDPWPPVLGRDPLRLFRHRRDAAHRPSLVGAVLPPAGGRSQLPLRSRARTRIQRADCSAQGRGTGDRSGGACVRRRLHHRPADHLGADPAQHLPAVLRPDLRDHPLYRHRAFLFPRQGRFRAVQPGGGRLQQRQQRDELFRRPLYRARRLQGDRRTADVVRRRV